MKAVALCLVLLVMAVVATVSSNEVEEEVAVENLIPEDRNILLPEGYSISEPLRRHPTYDCRDAMKLLDKIDIAEREKKWNEYRTLRTRFNQFSKSKRIYCDQFHLRHTDPSYFKGGRM